MGTAGYWSMTCPGQDMKELIRVWGVLRLWGGNQGIVGLPQDTKGTQGMVWTGT